MNRRERLVHMANQIARNIPAQGADGAAAAVADHIAAFWDPRMKAPLLADPAGLDEIAAAAFAILRRDAHPEHQSQATEFSAVDGAGRSDAG